LIKSGAGHRDEYRQPAYRDLLPKVVAAPPSIGFISVLRVPVSAIGVIPVAVGGVPISGVLTLLIAMRGVPLRIIVRMGHAPARLQPALVLALCLIPLGEEDPPLDLLLADEVYFPSATHGRPHPGR